MNEEVFDFSFFVNNLSNIRADDVYKNHALFRKFLFWF